MAKVLVVDDSDIVRKQLREHLEKAQHSVQEAFDGLNALALLEAFDDLDIMICDVNMPRMDGLTLCSEIKKMKKFSETQILMLTTESNPELKEKGKSLGVRAWITKPVAPERLIAAIELLLSKKS